MNFGARKSVTIAIAVIVALSFAARLVDIDKPYETWDEITSYSLGLNMLYNIAKMDFSPQTWNAYSENYTGSYHPPMGRYLYGIVNGIYIYSIKGPALFSMNYSDAVMTMYLLKNYEPGRLFGAALSAGAAVLLFLMVRKRFGIKTAVLASVIFVLLPVSLAQTKIAALEPPLLFFYTLSIYLFLRGLEDRRFYYLSLISVGISTAVKYNSATLFLLLPALYFAHRDKKAICKKHLLLYPIVSFIILWMVWPRLWFDPVGGMLSNMVGWGSMTSTTGVVPEYFLGGFNHPITYESIYVMVTTPAVVLVFFLIGIASSLKKRTPGYLIFLLWFLVPLIMYAPFNFKMAGPRYIFMVFPALATIAALGASELANVLARVKPSMAKYAMLVIGALLIIYLMFVNASIHPFYLDYYNEFVGGPKNVYENNLFAIGRSGEGIGEAAFWLYDNALENSSVQFFVTPRHVIPPVRHDLVDLTPFKPKYLSNTGDNENWDMTNVKPEADYIVESVYFRLYMNSTFHDVIDGDYALIHTVDAGGAPLAWVFDRKTPI